MVRKLGLVEERLGLLHCKNCSRRRCNLLLALREDLAGIITAKLGAVFAVIPANHGLITVRDVASQVQSLVILPKREVGECKEIVVVNVNLEALIVDHRPRSRLLLIDLCNVGVFKRDKYFPVDLADALISPRLQILGVRALMAARGPLAAEASEAELPVANNFMMQAVDRKVSRH